MDQIQVNDRTLTTDNLGYLLDPSEWSPAVALEIAAREEIEMEADHWAVVSLVRELFERNQSVPEARYVLKVMKTMLGPDKATRKFLHSLFPYGYGPQVCKIAGTRMPRKVMLDV